MDEGDCMASKKRKVTDGSSHAVRYCEKWESEFTWLVPEGNEVGVVVGMFVGTNVRASTTTRLCGMRSLVYAYARIVCAGIA